MHHISRNISTGAPNDFYALFDPATLLPSAVR